MTAGPERHAVLLRASSIPVYHHHHHHHDHRHPLALVFPRFFPAEFLFNLPSTQCFTLHSSVSLPFLFHAPPAPTPFHSSIFFQRERRCKDESQRPHGALLFFSFSFSFFISFLRPFYIRTEGPWLPFSGRYSYLELATAVLNPSCARRAESGVFKTHSLALNVYTQKYVYVYIYIFRSKLWPTFFFATARC